MAILGAVVVIAVVPFCVFSFMNFTGLPVIFFVVPAVMGLMGIGAVVVGVLQFTGKAKFGRVIEAETSASDKAQSTEDRLDELERLKRRDMVTPEEYAAKRQEILKDL